MDRKGGEPDQHGWTKAGRSSPSSGSFTITAYTYQWVAGAWGSCSGGSQTRSVSCQRSDGATVASTFCSGSAPTSSQSCQSSTCPGHAVSQRGSNGAQYTCSCDASSASGGAIWGTTYYTDDSSLCYAARHAGRIGAGGGTITYVIYPGLSSYAATTQNGITSYSWGSWGGSYYFR